jgi:hypothetical protein
MSRSTTPPGQLGEDARSGVPGNQGGAENAQGITPEMRKGPAAAQQGLDEGPDRGERGEYKPRNYELGIPERPLGKPKRVKPFVRMDR